MTAPCWGRGLGDCSQDRAKEGRDRVVTAKLCICCDSWNKRNGNL